MRRFLLIALLGAFPAVMVPVNAQDHDDHHDNVEHKKYYDRDHKDSHDWDDHEATAWNQYRDDHHVKQVEFAKATKRQQQDYWNWRHDHPDAH